MILYRTIRGTVAIDKNQAYLLSDETFDSLIVRDDLGQYLKDRLHRAPACSLLDDEILAPIESQEVWAAGVTYFRSRDARIEESKATGAADCYDRVYTAERPELFFKAPPRYVAGPNDSVRIRKDASWSVPEPELAVVLTPNAKIIGYTIGNDVSSRDIEGANPLYLPQAKVYEKSCALGPGILVADDFVLSDANVRLTIKRTQAVVFDAEVSLSELKRSPESLAGYLFRDQSFPAGCILLTGTGIVPPSPFTLMAGDRACISITRLGTLTNTVEQL